MMIPMLIMIAGTAGVVLVGLLCRKYRKTRAAAIAAVILGSVLGMLLWYYSMGAVDVWLILYGVLYLAIPLAVGAVAAVLIGNLLVKSEKDKRAWRDVANEPEREGRGARTKRLKAETTRAEEPEPQQSNETHADGEPEKSSVPPGDRKTIDMSQLKTLVSEKNFTAARAKVEQILNAGYQLSDGETQQLQTIRALLYKKMEQTSQE